MERRNPNSAIKSGLGLCFLGLGFMVFAASANSMDAMAQTPMWYLIMGYFILTIGELLISPIGLSKMTELSPAKYLSFVMGVFFTSSFYGHFFAGKIAKLTSITGDAVNPFSLGLFAKVTEFITGLSPSFALHETTAFAQLYSYVSVYACFGLMTMVIGIIALMIAPIIKNMMRGVH